jgi:hypothetical protein
MAGAANRLSSAAVIKKIGPVFAEKGVPAWLWLPIAARESGFNSTATANTSSELSKGIFQINLKAHPEYTATDLYDPVTNATIARDVFIKPAYDIAKTLTNDPRKQALIVYSGLKNPESLDTGENPVYILDGGIRPKWTRETRDAFLKYYDQYSGTPVTISIPSSPLGSGIQPLLAPVEGQGAFTAQGGTGGAGAIGMTAEGVQGVTEGLSGSQKWAKVGITGGIVLVMLVAGFMMIGGQKVIAVMGKAAG